MKTVDKKKKEQLGMSHGKAGHKLARDIMWSLIVKLNETKCCKCGLEMIRENFSIEHIKPWLDSENPSELYFDMDNIGFSHFKCNVSSARQTRKKPECGSVSKYNQGCRCVSCTEVSSRAKIEYRKKNYCPIKRREKYLRKGT